MIELSAIYALIVACLPSLSAIVAIICAIIKVAKDNKEIVEPLIQKYQELKQEIAERKKTQEIIDALMTENRQIRQELADLITELKKQKYEIPNQQI